MNASKVELRESPISEESCDPDTLQVFQRGNLGGVHNCIAFKLVADFGVTVPSQRSLDCGR
jgi:hypothetical protein